MPRQITSSQKAMECGNESIQSYTLTPQHFQKGKKRHCIQMNYVGNWGGGEYLPILKSGWDRKLTVLPIQQAPGAQTDRLFSLLFTFHLKDNTGTSSSPALYQNVDSTMTQKEVGHLMRSLQHTSCIKSSLPSKSGLKVLLIPCGIQQRDDNTRARKTPGIKGAAQYTSSTNSNGP